MRRAAAWRKTRSRRSNGCAVRRRREAKAPRACSRAATDRKDSPEKALEDVVYTITLYARAFEEKDFLAMSEDILTSGYVLSV